MTCEIKQGQLYRSNDGEYVYNIFAYDPDHDTMIVDILNSNLETIATKPEYPVSLFQDQLKRETIINFREDEPIGGLGIINE